MRTTLKCRVLTILALIVIFFGAVSMVTPIPGGTLLMALGLALLIYASPKARLCVQWARSRMARLDRIVAWLERKAGSRIAVISDTLAKTRPLQGTENRRFSHSEYVAHYMEKERQENAGGHNAP